MAEDAEDRTEAPTARRLQRARESGDVAISREVPPLVALASLAAVLTMAGAAIGHGLLLNLAGFLGHLGDFEVTGAGGLALHRVAVDVLRASLPFMLAAGLAGAAATLAQTGLLFSPDRLLPDLGRLDPRRGFKRVFGPTNLVEALRSLVKIVIVGAICWHTLRSVLGELAAAPLWEAGTLLGHILHVMRRVLFAILGAQAAIVMLDLAWVRLRHARKLRMSREDVKQEARESEGDPHVKGRLKQLRMQRARKRMLEGVRSATLVVTNPTHYAVALRYDRNKNAAPRVVAKGVDHMAARIRAIAEENDVPLVANPPLARALHRVEVDADIPPEHYQAVAELIAYVWRLQKRMGRAA